MLPSDPKSPPERARAEPVAPPTADATQPPAVRAPRTGPCREVGGPTGPEPTRFGDWEKNGRCIDF